MEYYNKNPGLKPIIQMNHSSFYITKLLFTPDKKVFISQNLTRIKFWDTKTRKLIKTIEGDFSMLHDISISPDGKILAGGCENIKFWDIETGKLIDSISGNFDWIQNLVFMPDGNHLAVVTLRMSDFDDDFVVYDDNEILDLVRLELWNINDKKIIWTKIIPTVPSFLKCTKNGWLVYNEKNVINLLNLKNPDNIKSFKGHSKSIRDVAFSPDGKLCSSCGRDRTIHIWNLETTDLLFTINEISDNEIYSLIFNQNGDLLIIGTDGEIIIWHLKKKRIIKKLQSPFSKNKKFPTPSIQALATFNNILIAASKGIEVWDITNFKLIEVLEPYDTQYNICCFYQ